MNTERAPLRHRNRWQISGESLLDLHRPPVTGRPVTVDANPTTIRFDSARTALIAVDLQNDFCTPGGWLASLGVDVSVLQPAVDLTAELLPGVRSADIPVIWLNWGNRPDQANIPPGVAHVYDPAGVGEGIGHLLPGTGSRVLEKDSWGAALADGLAVDAADIWVDKYRMSGFWDTPLDSVLRNLRVDTLLFTGVNSDQCVYATLIDAACLGYDVVLLTDAAATTSPAFCHDATIHNVRQCFGFTTTTEHVLDALKEAMS